MMASDAFKRLARAFNDPDVQGGDPKAWEDLRVAIRDVEAEVARLKNLPRERAGRFLKVVHDPGEGWFVIEEGEGGMFSMTFDEWDLLVPAVQKARARRA